MSDGFWRSSTEGSDSNSGCMPAAKRPRHENPAASVKFKGVVLQQNGHWGAQIYANHQRIWLGTFRSEREAAMAYDSAAIKLRSGDSHRNFPQTSLSLEEHNFQALYTTEAVLDMIKDGSYDTKLAAFIRSKSTADGEGDGSCAEPESVGSVRGGGSVVYQQLFQKELTPSDVGKLNRLVIPKKHAVKYFPSVIAAAGGGQEDEGEEDEVQLLFLDSNLKTWKFRYCYWKSSQSFVFTRGWNRFVKEKGLRSKDVVCFYKCGLKEGFSDGQAFCMIDVRHHSHEGVNHSGIEILGRKILQKEEDDAEEEEEAGVGGLEEGDQKVVGPVTQEVERKGVKLFGVLIT
uniref:TF-B3 domain-containing protein n=2 Tax=Nymphaea colorata TaxID=210225 RepID=A0A5K1FB29_9MAGN|nr:unnamed protein product [Nymphaea colorata]